MNTEIIYHVQSGPFWDWRVALDLFLGGMGVGALLFAVLLDEAFKGKYRRICQTAAWLSPLFVAAGLLLVMWKLGRPFHLFLAYTNFNPTAPLWWGGVFQPLLVVGAIVYAFKWIRPGPHDPVRRWAGRLLAPLALIVGVYHGMLLSVMVARPLWIAGPTVVAALLGFASTGIAVVMLVHLFRMKVAGRLADEAHVAEFLDDMRGVRNILVAVLVIQFGTCFLWWLGLEFGGLRHQQALAVANATYGPMFWWLGLGLGLILPLGLGAIAVLRHEAAHRHMQVTMIGLTSALILVGGYFVRLALVLGGQGHLPVNIVF
jgi:protein NrfD